MVINTSSTPAATPDRAIKSNLEFRNGQGVIGYYLTLGRSDCVGFGKSGRVADAPQPVLGGFFRRQFGEEEERV